MPREEERRSSARRGANEAVFFFFVRRVGKQFVHKFKEISRVRGRQGARDRERPQIVGKCHYYYYFVAALTETTSCMLIIKTFIISIRIFYIIILIYCTRTYKHTHKTQSTRDTHTDDKYTLVLIWICYKQFWCMYYMYVFLFNIFFLLPLRDSRLFSVCIFVL